MTLGRLIRTALCGACLSLSLAAAAVAAPPAPLACPASVITGEEQAGSGMVVYTAAFDSSRLDALREAGCAAAQAGCNTCVEKDGKMICSAKACKVTASATMKPSCSWRIAKLACVRWSEKIPANGALVSEKKDPDKPAVAEAVPVKTGEEE